MPTFKVSPLNTPVTTFSNNVVVFALSAGTVFDVHVTFLTSAGLILNFRVVSFLPASVVVGKV
ncbi:hypothetical protein Barb7_01431 [Bacteroidales bacterium Barb7]|nr:hypothetical protein Barb7_01431 [Bacteroidales bacterium Barb7]